MKKKNLKKYEEVNKEYYFKDAKIDLQKLSDLFLKYNANNENKHIALLDQLNDNKETLDELFKPILKLHTRQVKEGMVFSSTNLTSKQKDTIDAMVGAFNATVRDEIKEKKEKGESIEGISFINPTDYDTAIRLLVERKKQDDEKTINEIDTAKKEFFSIMQEAQEKNDDMIINGYQKEIDKPETTEERKKELISYKNAYQDICNYTQLKKFVETNFYNINWKRVNNRLKRYIDNFEWKVNNYAKCNASFKRVMGSIFKIANNLSPEDKLDRKFAAEVIVRSLLIVLIYTDKLNTTVGANAKVNSFTVFNIYSKLVNLCCSFDVESEIYKTNLAGFISYLELIAKYTREEK